MDESGFSIESQKLRSVGQPSNMCCSSLIFSHLFLSQILRMGLKLDCLMYMVNN